MSTFDRRFVYATLLGLVSAWGCTAEAPGETEAADEALGGSVLALKTEAAALHAIHTKLATGTAPDALDHDELVRATLHRVTLPGSLSPASRFVFDQLQIELEALGVPHTEWANRFSEAPVASTPEFVVAVEEYGSSFLAIEAHVDGDPLPHERDHGLGVGGVGHATSGLSGGGSAHSTSSTSSQAAATPPPKPTTFMAKANLMADAAGLGFFWWGANNVTVLNWQCTEHCGWFWLSCCAWQCQQEVVDGPAAGNCKSEGATTTTEP